MDAKVDVSDMVRYLSIERLTTFHNITGSHYEAIKLHQQTLRFGASLMTVMAVIEIALRNAICDQLDAQFGAGWLLHPPAPFQWKPSERNKITEAHKHARRSMYAKMNQAQKRALALQAYPQGLPPVDPATHGRHLRIVAAAQKQIVVSVGQIVLQLTLFFWKRLYAKDYDQALWKSLKLIFPDKTLKRANIAAQLEVLYQNRNRIAHHEPVYGRRLAETMNAIDFFIQHFDGLTAEGAPKLASLLEDDIAQLRSNAEALKAAISSFQVVGEIA